MYDKPKTLFEVYKDGELIHKKIAYLYGNKRRKRAIKTIYSDISKAEKEMEKGRICIPRRQVNPMAEPPMIETYLHPDRQTGFMCGFPSLEKNIKTNKYASSDFVGPPNDDWEFIFTHHEPYSVVFGFGFYVLPPKPRVGEIFYIEETIETLHLRDIADRSRYCGPSSKYEYTDIEARWTGEDLEYIALPCGPVIG